MNSYSLTSFISIFLCNICNGQITDIKVKSTWDEAIVRAQFEHKPIFLDFYTTWCMPCKKMDNLISTDNDLLTFMNKNFVSLKINAECDFGKILKRKYNVQSYPSYLFLDGELNAFHRVIGFKEKRDFSFDLNSAIKKYKYDKPLSYYQKEYVRNSNNKTFTSVYLKKLLETNNDSLAKPILNKYFEELSLNEVNKVENIELLASYIKDCQDPYFQIIVKAYNTSSSNSQLQLKVARCFRSSIRNSLLKAIKLKDDGLLGTILSIQNSDKLDLDKDISMMQTRIKYFKETNQNDKFNFWVEYYMNIFVDTEIDSLRCNAKSAYKRIFSTQPTDSKKEADFIENWVDGNISSLSGDLNYFSRLYLEEKSDTSKLQKALIWSYKACLLKENAEYLSTHAQLLFRLGRVSEAIIAQQKCINLSSNENESFIKYKAELDFMKKNNR